MYRRAGCFLASCFALLALAGCTGPSDPSESEYCSLGDNAPVTCGGATAEVRGSDWLVTFTRLVERQEEYVDRNVRCTRTVRSCAVVNCYVGGATSITKEQAIALCKNR